MTEPKEDKDSILADGDGEEERKKKKKFHLIIIIYPIVLTVIGIIINIICGLKSLNPKEPSLEMLRIMAVSGIIMIINHTWIMTSTETTRNKYGLFATPEEWKQNNKDSSSASQIGLNEVTRRHNIHRNMTENTIYYMFLSIIFMFGSPSIIAFYIWILLYPIARLGYTFAYLSKNTDLRGLFMSLSLLSMYGIASYLFFSIII